MTLPGPRFTYEDYLTLPEDKRYEVLEGDLLVTPAPSARHQQILLELAIALSTFVKSQGMGQVLPAPVDVVLANDTVVQPDLLFVAQGRKDIITKSGGVHGAPDLVVEILSPATASRDQVGKRKLYGKYGVREYWIVDPAAQSIEVLIPGTAGLDTWRVFPTGSALTSPLLPGLSVALTDVFAE